MSEPHAFWYQRGGHAWCGKPMPLEDWIYIARLRTFGHPRHWYWLTWIDLRGPFRPTPMHAACCEAHLKPDMLA